MLAGRWTFQVVEEYDDGYYARFREHERAAREELMAGRRHVFEAEMKELRRTPGREGHETRPADVEGDPTERTPAQNATLRNVFVIGPDKKIKLILVYPMTTGRNFDEVLRVIDSLQLTANHKVATPVNWKDGDDVIIVPSVSDEAAKEKETYARFIAARRIAETARRQPDYGDSNGAKHP